MCAVTIVCQRFATGEEGLEGDKGNIPRFSLCWCMAVGRERGASDRGVISDSMLGLWRSGL